MSDSSGPEPGGAEQDGQVQKIESSPWRNLVGFWILGLCNNFGYVVILTAAYDIIARIDPSRHTRGDVSVDSSRRECNYMSTGAILLADIVPSLLTKIVAPFCPLNIHVRISLVVILGCAGFIVVAVSDTQNTTLVGVIATAFSSGLGEATLLSYMSFFSNANVISTWSSGTGGAGLAGSFSYAFLKGLGLSHSTSLYSFISVPLIMAITFWVVLDKPNIEPSGRVSTEYSNLNRVPHRLNDESVKEKLSWILPLLKYMVPISLVYLFEYFINQGLFELVYFDNAFIGHAEQYRWYQVIYQIGVFISRSSINVIKIDAIWLLAVFQGINVICFTFEAFLHLPPAILYLVLVNVLWEGLLGGGAYVNTFYRINREVIPEKREFSMAFTSLGDALGITISGFLAIPVHNYICSLPRDIFNQSHILN